MPNQIDINSISALLRQYKLRFGTERALQDDIERVFTESGLPFVRERSLGKAGTIDFAVRSVGIECKVDGSKSAVLAQLQRYAYADEIKSLLLVTSRHTHRMDKFEINGKPVQTLWIAGRL